MPTIKHIQHLKSKELSGSTVKKPSASLFADGEIIVNYNSQNPTLFLRDDLGAVREFPVRESVLGKTDVASDSSKLGGIAATNYYHSGNSNKSDVNWSANDATFYGNVTLGPKITATYNSGKTFCDFKMTDVDLYLGHSGRTDNPTIYFERKNTTAGTTCYGDIVVWDDRGTSTLSFNSVGHVSFSNKNEPVHDFVVRSKNTYYFSDYVMLNPAGGKTIIGKFRENSMENDIVPFDLTAQLTVLGDIDCTNININGNINQISSKDFKTNIDIFNKNALDLITNINIVSYNYKNDLNTKHIGFIAEDTPKELTTEKQNVMDLGSCVGVLIKAVQELQNEIKILKNT